MELLGRRPSCHESARLVVQEPADARQTSLEGVERERLEGAVEGQARHDHGDGDEADERHGELARDAAAQEVDERLDHGVSVSKR